MRKSSARQVATCQQFHQLLLSNIVAAKEVNRRGDCIQTTFHLRFCLEKGILCTTLTYEEPEGGFSDRRKWEIINCS